MGTGNLKTMTQIAAEDPEFREAWDRLYGEASRSIPFTERMTILYAMAAKFSRANDRINWQPIETAPKDGTVVLLVAMNGDTPFINDGRFDDEHGWQWGPMEPTHWAPLNLPGDDIWQ